jgi:Flp pilus assembly protein TadB
VKTRHIFLAAPLVPLFIVIILATAGITLNVWVYVVLAVVCPLAAGAVWFLYKDMEKRM